MMVSGWALAIARSGPPISPSREFARTVSDSIRTPDFSFGATMSIIACMIEGTPAMTMTLSILKPGAIRDPRHPQPRLIQFARVLEALLEARHDFRMVVDADPERLGHAVSGD